MSKSSSDKNQSLFIRQSSGLIREVSPWSSFFAVFGLVTGGIPILILTWLYLSPGANWTLSYLITLIPTLGMAFLFYIAAVSTPRAGGDYVFNTRSSHPIVGFVNYWGLWIAFALSLGLYSYLGAQWFAYLFTGIGLYYDNASLVNIGTFFTSTLGSVIVGIVILGVSSIVSSTGKYGWRFILLAGLISIIATLITFVELGLINPVKFYSSLSSFTGVSDAYKDVVSSATSNGLSFVSPLQGALLAIPVVWYYYVWYNLPASWSGEMRKVKVNALLSIILGILFVGIYYILYTFLNFHAFGENFLTSWSYILANNVNSSVVYDKLGSIGVFSPFFALLVNHNIVIYILMWIALWLPNFYSLSPLTIALTRYLFAWSFDRILPESLADVNERFHIPLKATIISIGVGILGLLLYAFVPAISIVDVTVVFEISYAIFAFTSALMPFIKKDLFNRIVPVKMRIGRIPIVSLIGFPVFGFLLYALTMTWGNPVLLPINVPTLVSLGVIYVSGIIIFLTSYFINSRRGIQMKLLFSEIPPE
ncbi:amino acid transporter [Sulfolobus sp. A20]|uniref:APC family permease n=1 Tax=Sulfolobaceae TaxID=118883 RepID=UPI000845DB97|nr:MULTISPECIES: APC family permease [unclassified Sulfolobus]TRM74680.1 APC family permease [Sulfolobus sp. A20-N-F8]TRM75207.1 APC family permease [Sulfolobus sp. E5]TRM80442.1 APC family permease [Sulfolobus sp. D5]TRM86801.1 APC family permease [Sulfolobus sp. C3]TRM98514.1 APC family permease [Sulfolobus sp. F1]TRM98711.1 APC family permease [Sulfolobus sp. E1]